MPIIDENCPACFEAPQERHRANPPFPGSHPHHIADRRCLQTKRHEALQQHKADPRSLEAFQLAKQKLATVLRTRRIASAVACDSSPSGAGAGQCTL